jgi:DNA-binding CsgD family transcriptional regulator
VERFEQLLTPGTHLTETEKQYLKLRGTGLSDAAICQRMNITPGNARVIVSRLKKKAHESLEEIGDPIQRAIAMQVASWWPMVENRCHRRIRQVRVSDVFPAEWKRTSVPSERLHDSEKGTLSGEGTSVPLRHLWNFKKHQELSPVTIYDAANYSQQSLRTIVPESWKLHRFRSFDPVPDTNGREKREETLDNSESEEDFVRGETSIHFPFNWIEDLFIDAIDRKYHSFNDVKPCFSKCKASMTTATEAEWEIDLPPVELKIVTLSIRGLNRKQMANVLNITGHSLRNRIYLMRKRGIKL